MGGVSWVDNMMGINGVGSYGERKWLCIFLRRVTMSRTRLDRRLRAL